MYRLPYRTSSCALRSESLAWTTRDRLNHSRPALSDRADINAVPRLTGQVQNSGLLLDCITESAPRPRVDFGCSTTEGSGKGAEHVDYRSRLSPQLPANCFL